MSSSGATVVDMSAAVARGGSNATSKTPPISQVKATAAVPTPSVGGTGGAKLTAGTAAPAAQAKPAPKDTSKSSPAVATPPARETPKVHPAKAVKPTQAAKPAQTKVQVEVAPPPAKAAKEDADLDPFAALASSLPAARPLEPPEPVYTGPEHGVLPEIGVLCGVREDTLPPDYRFTNVCEKPMTTDEALDSLSFGFTSDPAAPAPVQQQTMDNVDAIEALSAGFSNFSPPPPSSVKSPAPPADKKAKMDTADFSLMGALSSPAPPQKPADPKPKAETPAAAVLGPKMAKLPTTVKGPKVEKPSASLKDTKSKTDAVDALSLDALAALGDTLGAPEPVPECPKLRPEDIVKEGKLTEEEGVLVGVREDTLPPEYRFSKDQLKDLPAPKPEPTFSPGEALDFLSGDFMTGPAAAPVVPAQQVQVESLSALDALAGDFMTPTQAASVQAPLPPLAKKTLKSDVCASAKPNTKAEVTAKKPEKKPAPQKDDFLDPFAALSDTLVAPEPAPEPPKLRPEDIVTEGTVDSEEGVLVGVREDTLPPEYRFSKDDVKDLPAPKPEPTLDSGEALDFLSGDFLMTPTLTPAVQAPVSAPPPAQVSADAAALDALAGDFVATSVVAPALKCAASQPTQTSLQMSTGATSALDALSDSLMDINPVPEPAPLPMKDIAKEKKIIEERLILMGEDDDTLPPEYRPTEEDIKAMAEAKERAPKEIPMGEAAALDLLSGDFMMAPSPAAPSAPCQAPAPVLLPPVLDSKPLKPMAGASLDSLADTLLPDALQAKTKGEKSKGKNKSRSKSKKHQAEDPSPIDLLSGELSTDLVSAKKGGKS
ncbi:hypothetical protein NHX12_029654 [Muraenolepis orangiensis]|uniref:Calpastatin n=1 Tax=Muraenolepis orangiensis TaxID=630683 RepID=A0A9Q0ECF0_9TELE|nr:hypothetical protein NHX12_029654 [Muraenolepis orangiensis]